MIIQNKLSKNMVVPDVELLARELTSSSQMGIILKKLLRLPIQKMLFFGIANMGYLPKIARKDFATGIKIICELEILQKLRVKSKKPHFILHSQMTDMAIALKNKPLLSYYFGLSRRYGFQPGIITYNIGPLIQFLSQLPNIPDDLIIYTPIQKNSFHMNPAHNDIIEYLKRAKVQFSPLKQV